jgi:hypothetical protein
MVAHNNEKETSKVRRTLTYINFIAHWDVRAINMTNVTDNWYNSGDLYRVCSHFCVKWTSNDREQISSNQLFTFLLKEEYALPHLWLAVNVTFG